MSSPFVGIRGDGESGIGRLFVVALQAALLNGIALFLGALALVAGAVEGWRLVGGGF